MSVPAGFVLDEEDTTLPPGFVADGAQRRTGASGEWKAPITDPRAKFGDAVVRFAKGAWHSLNPANLLDAALHPVDTVTGLIDTREQFGAAVEDFRKARNGGSGQDYINGTYHAISSIPVAGPIADSVTRTIMDSADTGDIAGAAGKAAGFAAMPKVYGKALGGVKNGVASAAEHLSRDTAPGIMRNLVKPKNAAMQFGADPGEFLVGLKTDSGGIGTLAPKVEAKLAKLQDAANNIADNTPAGRSVPVDFEGPIRAAFQNNITAAMRDNNTALASRLQGVLDQELASLHQRTAGMPDATVTVGRAYHQELGGLVRQFSNDPIEGTIRTARQEAWEGIRANIDEAVPQLRGVNKQIHSGIAAAKAVSDAALTASKGDPLSFKHMVADSLQGPYVRSRVAAGMRGMKPSAPEPTPRLLRPEGAPPGLPDDAGAGLVPYADSPLFAADDAGMVSPANTAADALAGGDTMLAQMLAEAERLDAVRASGEAALQRTGKEFSRKALPPAPEPQFVGTPDGRLSQSTAPTLPRTGASPNDVVAGMRSSADQLRGVMHDTTTGADVFGYGDAVARLQQEVQHANPSVMQQSVAGKRAVYVLPDGSVRNIPAQVFNAFARTYGVAGDTPLQKWLAAMQKQGKLKPGGRVMFLNQ